MQVKLLPFAFALLAISAYALTITELEGKLSKLRQQVDGQGTSSDSVAVLITRAEFYRSDVRLKLKVSLALSPTAKERLMRLNSGFTKVIEDLRAASGGTIVTGGSTSVTGVVQNIDTRYKDLVGGGASTTVTPSQPATSIASLNIDRLLELLRKTDLPAGATCTPLARAIFSRVNSKCATAFTGGNGCCPVSCMGAINARNASLGGKTFIHYLTREPATVVTCVKRWKAATDPALRALVTRFSTLMRCARGRDVCNVDNSGCTAQLSNVNKPGSIAASMVALHAACSSLSWRSGCAATAGCRAAIRAWFGATQSDQPGRCLKSLIKGTLKLTATAGMTMLQRASLRKLAVLKVTVGRALRCHMMTQGPIPGLGQLPVPAANCTRAVKNTLVPALASIRAACTGADNTAGTCASCSPGCVAAIKAGRSALAGAASGSCLAALVKDGKQGISNALRSFLARAGRVVAACARLNGVRIKGFGTCSAQGSTQDCSGLGVCLNKTVGCNTFFACRCNRGFTGKFCEKETPLPEPVALYRYKCAANGDGQQCSGNGQCVTRQLGRFRFKRCLCKNGFFGRSCNSTLADVRALDKVKEARATARAAIQAARARAAALCTSPTARFLCAGPLVAPAKRGTCVARPALCFPAINAALRKALQRLRQRCANGTATGTMCDGDAPVSACGDSETRCDDGSCAATCPAPPPTGGRCANPPPPPPNAGPSAGMPPPPPTPYPCPDGVTCAADAAGCVAAGSQWNGCPTGKVRCPTLRRTCVSNVKECMQRIGCVAGLKFCGWQRTQGVAVMNGTAGRPKPLCKPQCAFFDDAAEPKNTVRQIAANAIADIRVAVAQKRAGAAVARRAMRIVLNKLRPLASATAPFNLSVSAVADSLKQTGAFRGLNAKNALLSTIYRVSVSRAVAVSLGQVYMSLAVNDDTANVDWASCAAVLRGAAAYSVESIEDVRQSVRLIMACKPEWSATDGCACAFNTTHFSSYAVGDTDTAAAIDDTAAANAESLAAAVSTTTAAGSGTGGTGGTGTGGGPAGTTSAASSSSVSLSALLVAAFAALAARQQL